MKIIHDLYEKDPENLLYPTWTPCKEHTCVYFYFNTANFASFLMMAKMTENDRVHITIIERNERNVARSCLVLADDYLIQLGGVEEQFDYLNMGAEVDNAKILKLDEGRKIFTEN